jgi:di/tricarboxylate transporter
MRLIIRKESVPMSAVSLPLPARKTVAYVKLLLTLAVSLALILVIGSIPDLGIHAKVAFITFGLAIVGWTLTGINDTYIALAAAIVFAATGIDEPGEFFETLGDPLIWLLFATFIIAAAVKVSGLSERVAGTVAGRARSVRQLFILALRTAMPNERIARALALLFPSVILLSAIASLMGAGAHLITADILWRTGGDYLDFGRWLIMGLPFALVSSFAALAAIFFMFLNKQDRAQPLALTGFVNTTGRWRGQELLVGAVIGGLVGLWATESLHGINATLIAILGALLLTAPFARIIAFQKALKEVDWSMLVFMAATLELGEALIESGGAQWLVDNFFAALQSGIGQSPLAAVALVASFGLLSHLVITSRSSRASVIIPMVIFLAVALGFSPTTFAFMTAAATGFCLTLPVSAKPVAMFSNVEGTTYTPRDLLRLSGVLLPVHLVFLVVFAFLIWPALGLDIGQARPNAPPAAPQWSDERPGSPGSLRPLIDLGTAPAARPAPPQSDSPDAPESDAQPSVNAPKDSNTDIMPAWAESNIPLAIEMPEGRPTIASTLPLLGTNDPDDDAADKGEGDDDNSDNE